MSEISLKEKINIAEKVIALADSKWKSKLGFAFTGRKDSTVVMHIALSVLKKSPKIMFIDHGLHFDESYSHLKKLVKLWNLDVEYVADKNLLNKLVKTKNSQKRSVLVRELKIKSIGNWITNNNIKAMASAIRWDENPARAWEKYFSKRDTHVRVHPILHFTQEDIWEYIKLNKIPYNPLYDQGYKSIGEKEFTKKSFDGDERSGREDEKEEIMSRLRSLGYF